MSSKLDDYIPSMTWCRFRHTATRLPGNGGWRMTFFIPADTPLYQMVAVRAAAMAQPCVMEVRFEEEGGEESEGT